MWTQTDSYLERLFKEEEKRKELYEKYKDTENEDIKFLVEQLKEFEKKNDRLEEQNDSYYKNEYKLRFKIRDYKNYSNKLEMQLRTIYRIKEGVEKGTQRYNRIIDLYRKEYDIKEDVL